MNSRLENRTGHHVMRLILGFVMLVGVVGCEAPTSSPVEPTAASDGAGDSSAHTAPKPLRPSWEETLASLTFSGDYDWQRVASESFRFSVMMPGKPHLLDAPSDTEITCLLKVGNDLVCYVDRVELSEPAVQQAGGAQGVLDEIRKDARTDPDYQVVNSRDIAINGYPGIEITKRMDRDGATAYSFERHCVVGNAVLECSWTWRHADINHPDVRSFLDSFYPHPQDGNVTANDDTPEAAIRAFYGALARGDSRSARHLLATPDELAEWVEIQARTSVAFKHLGESAIARFGDQGKSLQVPVPAEVAVQKLDTVKPVADGDTAEWPANPQAPLKMTRIDGRWRLDVYASFPSRSHVEQANDVHGRTAAYVGKIAADLDAGKFESVADVQEELQRQREAMNRGLANPAPATRQP